MTVQNSRDKMFLQNFIHSNIRQVLLRGQNLTSHQAAMYALSVESHTNVNIEIYNDIYPGGKNNEEGKFVLKGEIFQDALKITVNITMFPPPGQWHQFRAIHDRAFADKKLAMGL